MIILWEELPDIEKVELKLTGAWVVDPGFLGSDENQLAFVEWVEGWEHRTIPCGRYWAIKDTGPWNWGGYKFEFLVFGEAAADEFHERWGTVRKEPLTDWD